jgi:hypothetical protein
MPLYQSSQKKITGCTDMKKIKENEYECAVCHGIFEKGWTDEEARAEEKETFGANDPDSAIVCDDCYNKMSYLWEQ